MPRLEFGTEPLARPTQQAKPLGTETLTAPRGSESTEQRGQVWRIAQSGLDLCRRGDWKGGLAQLAVIETAKGAGREIPGLALTYFGYGIAAHQGRVADGLRYCRAGVDRESWQAENHLNLARTYLLAGVVKRAVAALDFGLDLDPANQAMLHLRARLGVRRPPVFSFLDRGHPLNRIAGRVRHRLAGAGTAALASATRGSAATPPIG